MVASASRTIKQQLIDTINNQNNLSLEFEQVTFEDPVMLDESVVDLTDPTKRNTSARFTAGGVGGSRVEAVVKYNRLSLPKMFELYSKTVPDVAEATTVHGVLAAIGERLGLVLDAEDFENIPLTDTGSMRIAPLVARQDSFVYFGVQILQLGAEAGEPVISHDADIDDVLFANPFPDGDWTLVTGAQGHYLNIEFPNGPTIAINGYDHRGDEITNSAPSATSAEYDTYDLIPWGQFWESLFETGAQGAMLAIGRAGASIFDGYEYTYHINGLYGTQAFEKSYNFKQRIAPNAMLDVEKFSDGNMVSPPPQWDPDTKSYRFVVTDGSTQIGLISAPNVNPSTPGLPLDSFAAATITVNALPAGDVQLMGAIGDVGISIPIRTLGTWSIQNPVAKSHDGAAPTAIVTIAFVSPEGEPLTGLDVTILIDQEEATQTVFEDLSDNRLYAEIPCVNLGYYGSGADVYALDFYGKLDYDPLQVAISGRGFPYGHTDVLLDVHQVASGQTYSFGARINQADQREEPTAQLLKHDMSLERSLPITFLDWDGNYPVTSQSGDPIALDEFVVARSSDFNTTMCLRAAYDANQFSSWYTEGQPTDKQNGPRYEAYIIDSERWVIDIAVLSADGVLLLDDAAGNSLELTIQPYSYQWEPETSTQTVVKGTAYTFVTVDTGEGYSFECDALGYSMPVQYWNEDGNRVVARIDTTAIGAAIDTALQTGVNGSGSPYGYYRLVLKRKKAGVIDSFTSCSVLIQEGTEV